MKKRIKSLDGLKGIACLLIAFFWHFYPSNFALKDFIPRFVEVYFAISGFGIAYAYKDILQQQKFSIWFSRRYFKIMPLYWLTFLLCLALQLYHYKIEGVTLLENYSIDFLHIFFGFIGVESGWIIHATPMNGPGWFISTLLLCYILYFLLCKLDQKLYIVLTFALLLFSSSGIFLEWNYPFLYFESSLRGYSSFSMGLLFYEIYIRINNKLGNLLSYLLIIFYVSYTCILNNIGHFHGEEITGEVRLLIIFFIIPVVLLSSLYLKPVKFLLETTIIQKLGTISLEIYLWHRFVQFILLSFTNIYGTWLGWIAFIIITISISVISHRYFAPTKISQHLINYMSANFIKK